MADKIEEMLTFDDARAQKVIDAVFAEEKNDAPRYNPFFLLQENGFLKKAIDAEYESSASLKTLTG